MKSITEISNLAEKTVLLRCDLNVTLNDDQEIVDDSRIIAALETIKYLLAKQATIVIVSHLGRPTPGKFSKKNSLFPVAKHLSKLLELEVDFEAEIFSKNYTPKSNSKVTLIENIRFRAEETSKDESERQILANELAMLGDIFVSDGFGVLHRNQASVVEIANLLPSYAGLLVEKEIFELSKLLNNPVRPYCVVLGGAKVSDKLAVIDNLLDKVDKIIISGAMAFTFLKAEGFEVASSLVEDDYLEHVLKYIEKANNNNVLLLLPVDILMAEKFSSDAKYEIKDIDNLNTTLFGENAIGLDIGPKSIEIFQKEILNSRTIFWNGPMGVFEFEAFSKGTKAIADSLANTEGYTVVGGGDSAAAISKLGFSDQSFDHISTGGGASLEFLEQKVLPGIEVLK